MFQVANRAHHPFLVNLHSSFQTSSRIFFVMEYAPGGDLLNHMRRSRGSQSHQAKFYACEIVLALEYLHSHGIVYRY